jgi:hypothetical protein
MMSALPLLLAAALLPQSPIEVPFKQTEDAMFVDAVVNGVKVSLLFDSGFGGSVLIDSGTNLGKPSGTIGLRDFVGTFDAPVIPIKSLSIGGLKVDATGMQAVQQPLSGMSADYNTHVTGILGFEAIKHQVTEINFEESKFVFHPSTVDITKRQPDGKRTFLVKLLPLGSDSMEMEVRLKNGKSLILALDTGNAFYVTTHKESLERAGAWDPDRQAKFMGLAGVASGPVDTFYKRIEDATVFGVPVKSAVCDVIDLPSSDAVADGTVGYQFLKNFNITIDYERRRVWLENYNGIVSNVEPASTGISGFMDPKLKRVVVARVSPESPAAEAGIKAGDHLLSIDGKDLAGDLSYRAIQNLMEGPKDSIVKLAVSRAGQLKRYELKRIPLVND